LRRLAASVVLAAVVLALPSCGSSRKPVYPVTGHLYLKAKPTAGATVVFHPVNSSAEDLAKPAGRVEEDGTFKLTTYTKDDGAPEGDYVVTVEWRAPKKSALDRFQGDRLQGRYGDPKSSTLRVHVDRGTSELQPIDLAARR
jgi:hypothetical protein